ncbi:MAG: hypothetical protein GEV06_29345 [Luteitalea sp.]|nr:hypothetical protein [Luteitalea sp.]MPZ47421.1 hypothetical protein [Betaproteobacteria bacterium]
MKTYFVVRRGMAWCALTETGHPPISSEDKSQIVAWACELARARDGEVYVHDAIGRLERVYTYQGGVERKPMPYARQSPARSPGPEGAEA